MTSSTRVAPSYAPTAHVPRRRVQAHDPHVQPAGPSTDHPAGATQAAGVWQDRAGSHRGDAACGSSAAKKRPSTPSPGRTANRCGSSTVISGATFSAPSWRNVRLCRAMVTCGSNVSQVIASLGPVPPSFGDTKTSVCGGAQHRVEGHAVSSGSCGRRWGPASAHVRGDGAGPDS
jgi:hypothetical protein